MIWLKDAFLVCTSPLKTPQGTTKKNLILSICQAQLVERSKFRKYRTSREKRGPGEDSTLHCKKVLSCQINKSAFFYSNKCNILISFFQFKFHLYDKNQLLLLLLLLLF